jgi:adenine phosphoribosyltransferase
MDQCIRKGKSGIHRLKLLGMVREMPFYPVSDGLSVAANEHLSFGCDVEFTRVCAREIARRVKPLKPDCLLTAEAKPVALAYEIARHLKHKRYFLARKKTKEKLGDPVSVPIRSTTANGRPDRMGRQAHLRSRMAVCASVRSITSGVIESLSLSESQIRGIRGKRVVVFDDCISTGSTVRALLELAWKAQAQVVAIASIWLEGPWPYEAFKAEIESGRLIYLDVLPVLADGKTYEALCRR